MQWSSRVSEDLASSDLWRTQDLAGSAGIRSCTSTGKPFDNTFFGRTYVSIQSRTAARKELLDQMMTPDECEKLYEESLWCLYALQDDLLQTGNPFMDEDRETIATCGWFFPSYHRLTMLMAIYLYRDQEDETTTGALSNSNGNESPRSGEWCSCRPEFGRCGTNPCPMGCETISNIVWAYYYYYHRHCCCAYIIMTITASFLF